LNVLHLFADDNNILKLDKIAERLQGLIDKTNVDNDKNQGLPEVYEFFTRYVRQIHPDTHWKRTMKINAILVFFQLISK
jgi:hypothetical protein